MKQFFLWFLVAGFAAWAFYSACQLANGWAAMVQRDGPWANKPKVAMPNELSVQLLFVALGLLSAIGIAAYATSDRWEKKLREACECDMTKCHCTIDSELLYRRPGSNPEN
jgi:hypothetical protein